MTGIVDQVSKTVSHAIFGTSSDEQDATATATAHDSSQPRSTAAAGEPRIPGSYEEDSEAKDASMGEYTHRQGGNTADIGPKDTSELSGHQESSNRDYGYGMESGRSDLNRQGQQKGEDLDRSGVSQQQMQSDLKKNATASSHQRTSSASDQAKDAAYSTSNRAQTAYESGMGRIDSSRKGHQQPQTQSQTQTQAQTQNKQADTTTTSSDTAGKSGMGGTAAAAGATGAAAAGGTAAAIGSHEKSKDTTASSHQDTQLAQDYDSQDRDIAGTTSEENGKKSGHRRRNSHSFKQAIGRIFKRRSSKGGKDDEQPTSPTADKNGAGTTEAGLATGAAAVGAGTGAAATSDAHNKQATTADTMKKNQQYTAADNSMSQSRTEDTAIGTSGIKSSSDMATANKSMASSDMKTDTTTGASGMRSGDTTMGSSGMKSDDTTMGSSNMKSGDTTLGSSEMGSSDMKSGDASMGTESSENKSGMSSTMGAGLGAAAGAGAGYGMSQAGKMGTTGDKVKQGISTTHKNMDFEKDVDLSKGDMKQNLTSTGRNLGQDAYKSGSGAFKELSGGAAGGAGVGAMGSKKEGSEDATTTTSGQDQSYQSTLDPGSANSSSGATMDTGRYARTDLDKDTSQQAEGLGQRDMTSSSTQRDQSGMTGMAGQQKEQQVGAYGQANMPGAYGPSDMEPGIGKENDMSQRQMGSEGLSSSRDQQSYQESDLQQKSGKSSSGWKTGAAAGAGVGAAAGAAGIAASSQNRDSDMKSSARQQDITPSGVKDDLAGERQMGSGAHQVYPDSPKNAASKDMSQGMQSQGMSSSQGMQSQGMSSQGMQSQGFSSSSASGPKTGTGWDPAMFEGTESLGQSGTCVIGSDTRDKGSAMVGNAQVPKESSQTRTGSQTGPSRVPHTAQPESMTTAGTQHPAANVAAQRHVDSTERNQSYGSDMTDKDRLEPTAQKGFGSQDTDTQQQQRKGSNKMTNQFQEMMDEKIKPNLPHAVGGTAAGAGLGAAGGAAAASASSDQSGSPTRQRTRSMIIDDDDKNQLQGMQQRQTMESQDKQTTATGTTGISGQDQQNILGAGSNQAAAGAMGATHAQQQSQQPAGNDGLVNKAGQMVHDRLPEENAGGMTGKAQQALKNNLPGESTGMKSGAQNTSMKSGGAMGAQDSSMRSGGSMGTQDASMASGGAMGAQDSSMKTGSSTGAQDSSLKSGGAMGTQDTSMASGQDQAMESGAGGDTSASGQQSWMKKAEQMYSDYVEPREGEIKSKAQDLYSSKVKPKIGK